MRPDRIRRAAEILREEAKCLFDSTTDSDGNWSDDPIDARARTSHDEMLALAIELDLLAGERNT